LATAGALAVVVLSSAPLSSQVVFRGGVDLINVTATVTDRNGRFIPDLKQEDFVLYDDGRPQEIASFSAERVPVSLGIALDVSGSMTPGQLATSRQAIRRLAYELLGEEDELFLASFAETTRMLQPWTTDRDLIDEALERTRTGFGTALYDAVRAMLPFASTGVHGKKALLVLSDGDDRNSKTNEGRLREVIRSMEVMVYALAVESPGTNINAGALRRFTDDTGGRTEVVKGFENLDAATARIAAELSQQYVIGYASPHPADGKWHTIKVEIRGRKDVIIRARTGYVAVS
jgi:Ca-activated chloride channel family protein